MKSNVILDARKLAALLSDGAACDAEIAAHCYKL